MKLLKFTLISILGLSLCTACGGDGDGGETPGPGKPEGPDKSSTTGIDRFDASNIFSRNTYQTEPSESRLKPCIAVLSGR